MRRQCPPFMCHLITSAEVTTDSGKVLKGIDAFKTTAEGQWILRNFAYHDIIGSISSRQKLLLDGSYLVGIADVVDSYLGVATELLALAAVVRLFEEEEHLGEDSPIETRRQNKYRFFSVCSHLERRLKGWRCRDDTSTELVAVAYAYRCAILIVLYRAMRNRLCSH
jgi:transcriptional activator protein UGA3